MNMSSQDVRLGYRIGKLALNLLNQNDSFLSESPTVYAFYYGHIGILFEPIQACVDQHIKAYQLGMQLGNTSISAIHKQYLIIRDIYATGKNLQDVKEEMEFDMMMAKHHGLKILGMKSQLHYEAVLNLIDGELNLPRDPNRVGIYDGAYILSRMGTLTYLGYFERVKHLVDEWEFKISTKWDNSLRLRNVYIYFLYGIASIGLCRKRNMKRLPGNMKKILKFMDTVAGLSQWNFLNKACL
jgi:hypothetical protein